MRSLDSPATPLKRVLAGPPKNARRVEYKTLTVSKAIPLMFFIFLICVQGHNSSLCYQIPTKRPNALQDKIIFNFHFYRLN